jgi:hypothetical protein
MSQSNTVEVSRTTLMKVIGDMSMVQGYLSAMDDEVSRLCQKALQESIDELFEAMGEGEDDDDKPPLEDTGPHTTVRGGE